MDTAAPGPRRIDVHQHAIPPVLSELLGPAGSLASGWPVPAWSVEEALAVMDSIGTDTGILSIVTPPTIDMSSRHGGATLARAVNEHVAAVVAERPDRFGLFASVPLPDVEAALAEVDHAFDDLGADGVVLMSNVHGTYLGDQAFDPLFQALDRRGAVVFVHPTAPPIEPLPGIPTPAIDFPFDTTRTAMHMVVNGVMDRYRSMRVILSHAGGFIPYAAARLTGVAIVNPSLTPDGILADLGRFYFDTALSASRPSLLALAEFAQPDHILFGSDWPFAPAPRGAVFTAALGAYEDEHPELRHSIDRGAAELLFPRLAAS